MTRRLSRNFLRRPTGAAGFMLIELLLAVALSVVAAAMFTQIFRTVWLLNNRSEHAANSISRFDGALNMMRADVFDAREINLPDAHTLRLMEADGRAITWKLLPDDSLHRQAIAEKDQIWPHLGGGMSLATQGAGVIVTAPNSCTTGDLHERIRCCLVSQVMLENPGSTTGRPR